MNEYVFEDLIINPKTPNLENLIGKEVYCNDAPLACLDYANEHRWTGILREVRHESTDYPFRVEIPEGGIFGFICIIPKREESEPEYAPFESKEEFVEKYMQIKEGVAFGPFEDSLLQCGMWLRQKCDSEDSMILSISPDGVFVLDTFYTWELLIKDFLFLDGTPCGKLVEAEHE